MSISIPPALGTSWGDHLAAHVSPGQGLLAGRVGVGTSVWLELPGDVGPCRFGGRPLRHALDLLLGGRDGGDSRAEEAGTLSDSARCLPRRKGSGPGVRAPGPSAAPREYLLCSLSGTDIGLDWEGLGARGGNLLI